MNDHNQDSKKESEDEKFPLPIYPPSEDIYRQEKELDDVDPETGKMKTTVKNPDGPNELDFSETKIGNDLDVPGSELDDEMEKTGNEDEENNYYSLGGDNHNDLEDDHAGEL